MKLLRLSVFQGATRMALAPRTKLAAFRTRVVRFYSRFLRNSESAATLSQEGGQERLPTPPPRQQSGKLPARQEL